jgi:hypothetical protein
VSNAATAFASSSEDASKLIAALSDSTAIKVRFVNVRMIGVVLRFAT